MEQTLYRPALIIAILTFVLGLLTGFTFYSSCAISVFAHQFYLTFSSIGRNLPIRYLFGVFMSLQMLLGPVLAYNGIQEYYPIGYRMKIPESDYFSYALPAVISFLFGLHAWAKKLEGEFIDEKKISKFIEINPYIPNLFILIGFFTSVLSSSVGSYLAFVFYLFGNLKFIGLFLIVIGDLKLKIFPLALIIGSIVFSSLGNGMFHDLLTWLIFILAIIAIKYKPSFSLKIAAMFIFVFVIIIIQQVKGVYRESIWGNGEISGFETFARAIQKSNQSNGIFNYENLAKSTVRINQGFIITNIMVTVPAKIPFANGTEILEILEAAFLPRFLAPNKLTAGNQELFTRYSGIKLGRGTSMGLSSIGDAYINFGIIGGCGFMFFLGLLYNTILKYMYRYSLHFPILILFTSLVFYYPIRPDCELQTILGHLVKSCFLLFLFFRLYSKVLRYSIGFSKLEY